ncbi:hypothetical protein D3229_06595 [Leucobacter aridicollis]|nr:hypothetical protein [Leucobacter aridicollis]
MSFREAKGFALFAGSGLAAVCLGLVAFGALPTGINDPSNSAEASSAQEQNPWDSPAEPCANASVKTAAQELRAAGFESLDNSTLAHPDEVSSEQRTYQQEAWRSLQPHEREVQHCLAALGAEE